ncbi:hypothetical protein BWI93_03905 [Siphonobacter sp. BAB-5385]|nr:hypothetical protein BWI93_03905 [Siphonobacter sp. BAB-5385]
MGHRMHDRMVTITQKGIRMDIAVFLLFNVQILIDSVSNEIAYDGVFFHKIPTFRIDYEKIHLGKLGDGNGLP